ncbi:MAG: excinuclease ABC subunit UvrA, partial [Planctomycetales bacterium]|nr:excinuclease ABC subunit UvrA [Planctomycetales bacterium]
KLDKRRKHTIELVVDRLVIGTKGRARVADSIETTLKWGDGLLRVLYQGPTEAVTAAWSDKLLSNENACPDCGISYGMFTPRHFSFNAPDGACRTCLGLGTKLFFDEDLLVPDHAKSIDDGAIVAWRRGGRRLITHYKMLLRGWAKHYGVDLAEPFEKLSDDLRQNLLQGSGAEEIEFTYWRKNAWRKMTKPFEGVIPNLE